MEIALSLMAFASVFLVVIAVDAWTTGRHKKGPGHWFQQHWFWQVFREMRWLFQDKPPTQRMTVGKANEGESARG